VPKKISIQEHISESLSLLLVTKGTSSAGLKKYLIYIGQTVGKVQDFVGSIYSYGHPSPLCSPELGLLARVLVLVGLDPMGFAVR
jgi:hypothetical protein